MCGLAGELLLSPRQLPPPSPRPANRISGCANPSLPLPTTPLIRPPFVNHTLQTIPPLADPPADLSFQSSFSLALLPPLLLSSSHGIDTMQPVCYSTKRCDSPAMEDIRKVRRCIVAKAPHPAALTCLGSHLALLTCATLAYPTASVPCPPPSSPLCHISFFGPSQPARKLIAEAAFTPHPQTFAPTGRRLSSTSQCPSGTW